jgi:hypothetical protein
MTSKIKVDNIHKNSDDSVIIKKCGSTTTIGSGSGQTVVLDGATVTLGRCGASVNLASGASQSGFGRTGTVDWCTTAKTSPFTGVSGKGYFVNTSGGAVTVTLPGSSSAGDIISLADYSSTWQTNNVTLCRNSQLINGGAFNSVLNTQGQSVTLVYVDGTKGWKNVQDSTSDVSGTPNYIVATGGTITTSGDYRIHTFLADANFTICSAPTPGNNKASYLVVAGGGAAANNIAGGGGGGGFREGKLSTDPYTASPLAATPCSAVTLTAGTTYPITVGAGAASPGPWCNATANGSSSVFSSITSTGGGKGGAHPGKAGSPGGSGGGGGGDGSGAAGSGNSPPVSPPQGNSGGAGAPNYPQLAAGGGGGAGASGGAGSPSVAGAGGIGAGTAINPATGTPGPSPSLKYYAGGGGGGIYSLSNPNPAFAPGGAGGGGNGWGTGNPIPSPPGAYPRIGAANTGGGAGQASSSGTDPGGTGGSGIVIIRYKYQ